MDLFSRSAPSQPESDSIDLSKVDMAKGAIEPIDISANDPLALLRKNLEERRNGAPAPRLHVSDNHESIVPRFFGLRTAPY